LARGTVALLTVALLTVALLPVALLTVALLTVALLTVALLTVALLTVALLTVAAVARTPVTALPGTGELRPGLGRVLVGDRCTQVSRAVAWRSGTVGGRARPGPALGAARAAAVAALRRLDGVDEVALAELAGAADAELAREGLELGKQHGRQSATGTALARGGGGGRLPCAAVGVQGVSALGQCDPFR
ncbi:MAG: hypothetical protein QOE64_555, partial [Frankiales bacterium]|nr:hypothetical protein [Frankiales bacterium]